jgi:hypothetical protein
MVMLGMVPTIRVFHSDRLTTSTESGTNNVIHMYGRVQYTSLMAAKADEQEFVKMLDKELAMLRADWIRNYKKQLKGQAPTHHTGGTPGYIEEKL